MPQAFVAASDLTRWQAALNASLPETAEIMRATPTQDAYGGQTVAWAQAGANVKCRVEPFFGRKGGTEEDIQGRFEEAAYWKVVMPANTDVTAKDRIAVGARTFEVVAVAGPETWEVERSAMCVEVFG